jgi:outer membrane scaffolding protein for murein synthesis (MipA/OmpV family)
MPEQGAVVAAADHNICVGKWTKSKVRRKLGWSNSPGLAAGLISTILASTLCILFVTTQGAAAQDLNLTGTPVPQSTQPWWYFNSNVRVSLGLGSVFAPTYEGSSKLQASPYPFIDITGLFHDRVSISTTHGIALNVIDLPSIKAGVNVSYGVRRTQGSDDHLLGVPDIGSDAVVGGFITYEFQPFSVGLAVQQRLGPSGGLTASLGGDYSFRPISRLKIAVGPRIVFADKNYEQSFFGVSERTSAEATALGNPLRSYDTAAGLRNVELVMSAKYALSERWSLGGNLGLSELLASAASSPLTQQKLQPTVAVAIICQFLAIADAESRITIMMGV